MGETRTGAWLRRQAGRGWLEFAVAAAALSILAAVLLQSLLAYQAIAEKAAVELTIMNMRTGMRHRITELILAGRTREVGRLVGANPVEWLVRPPDGYVGEVADAAGEDRLAPGSWYFERRTRELVYLVSHDSDFQPLDGGPKAIRLKVVPSFDTDRDGALLGVAIARTNRYHWQ